MEFIDKNIDDQALNSIPQAGVGALSFFSYIISFDDLIISQCFTYYFYMEDSVV